MDSTRICGRRGERGQSLISVIISVTIILIVAIGTMSALGSMFHSGRNSEPHLVAQGAVSNVQTDLEAMSMYDTHAAATLSHATAGKTIIMAVPSPSASGYFPPADVNPTMVTIQRVTPATGSSPAAIDVQSAVAAGGSAAATTMQSTISVSQGAPVVCDPNLHAAGGC